MALVMVLLMLVLITVLVVGFTSLMTQDRAATHNYAMRERAQQIGLSALDQVQTLLQYEATDTARNSANGTGTHVLYLPSDPAYAIPSRMPGQASPAILKYSVPGGVPFYSPATGGLGTNMASGSCSTNTSFNGRTISIDRWNKPQLLETTAGFVPPNWIYVGRNGPVLLPAGTNPSAQKLSSVTLTNDNAVMGRYAYVVYDTSGLLDLNVAGHPSSETAATARKGPIAWADLTQLTNALQASDIDALVSWRNAAQTSTYSNYVANASTNGFRRVAPGDTAFLGRQELIQYASLHPVWKGTLPYLTTFSRAVQGPTWGPTTNMGTYLYSSSQFSASSTNGFLPQARVIDTAWTRWDGSKPVQGEPLLKLRFPLNKLSLLEKMQGLSSLSSQDIDDIARYFGLDPVNDSNGYYRHWNYPTTNGKYHHTQGQILTLDQVSKLSPGREPDFFELLQAGILNGSLGASGRGDSPLPPANDTSFYSSSFQDPDTRKIFQILRIGANIIDQASSDNYPTTITLASTGDNVYGIQDLPYLNKIYITPYASPASKPPFELHLYFELWNPHQSVAADSGASPKQFRLIPFSKSGITSADQISDWYQTVLSSVQGGGTKYWIWNGENNAWDTVWQYQHMSKLASGGIVPFTMTSRSSQYRQPSLIASGSPSAVGSWSPPVSSLSVVSLHPIPAFPNSTTLDVLGTTAISWPPVQWSLKLSYSFVYCLQFQDSGGNWRTYSTFVGSDNPATPSPGSAARGGPALGGGKPNPVMGAFAIAKGDPRTYRFGAGFANTLATTNTPSGPLDSMAPFVAAAVSAAAPYRMDYWAVNDAAVGPPGTTASGAPYYKSLDTAQRPGDMRYTTFTAANGPLTATAPRPIILNRPFQSVGELGYAFRDEPWKTLDLFSPGSADAGLLDLFSAGGPVPVAAGTVNPNTSYSQVAAALLSGAEQNPAAGTTITPSQAQAIGQALVTLSKAKPFGNRAELVDRLMADPTVAAVSGNKSNREAVIRALAECADTRTWNVLIDVIAQSGTYPATSTRLDNFLVNGETRYWLHLAIDRYTGQVVDRQLEIVNE